MSSNTWNDSEQSDLVRFNEEVSNFDRNQNQVWDRMGYTMTHGQPQPQTIPSSTLQQATTLPSQTAGHSSSLVVVPTCQTGQTHQWGQPWSLPDHQDATGYHLGRARLAVGAPDAGRAVMTRETLIPPGGVLEPLPCMPYSGHGRQVRESAATVIRFQQADGSEGISLMHASRRVCYDLLHEDVPAFPPDVAAKTSIWIHVIGHEVYSRQFMSRRSTSVGEPISLKELARKIAEEMDKYLEKMRESGKPLTYRGAEVRLEDLFLGSLHRVAQGSWMPRILVHTRSHP